MPLVIHTNSCCDVCLENYTCKSGTRPSKNATTSATTNEGGVIPGAIPCGHIFCISCLNTISPPICPLCRTRYAPDRIKKVHVDLMESSDDLFEDLDLLTAMLDTALHPTEELKLAIDRSIKKRGNNNRVPLNKAKQILGSYIREHEWKRVHEPHLEELEKRVRDAEAQQLELRHFTRNGATTNGYPAADTNKSKSEHKQNSKRKIAELERTILGLQHQLVESNARRSQQQPQPPHHPNPTLQNNPLPEPPRPFPESQIPTLPQYLSGHAPIIINDSASSGSGGARVSTYANMDSDPGPSRRPRKNSTNSKQQQHYRVYADPPDDDVIVVGSAGRGIIPGAPPSERFIPPPPPTMNASQPSGNQRLHHASVFVSGYGQGHVEGYTFVNSSRGPDRSTGYIPSGHLAGAGYPQGNAVPTPSDVDSAPPTDARPSSRSARSRRTVSSMDSTKTGSTWGTIVSNADTFSSASLNLTSFPQVPEEPTQHVEVETYHFPMPTNPSQPQPHATLRDVLTDPLASGSGSTSGARASSTNSVVPPLLPPPHPTSSSSSSSYSRRPLQPQMPSTIPEIQSDSESMSTNRRHRRHHRHRQNQSTGDNNPPAPIVINIPGRMPPAASPTIVLGNPFSSWTTPPTGNNNNALGLDLNVSHTDDNGGGAATPIIIAPTPRTSNAPFLRLFGDRR